MKRSLRSYRFPHPPALAVTCAFMFALIGCASGDATRQDPCVAPIAGVCAPPATTVKPERAIGGGPAAPEPAAVVIPSGPDAGIAMPQFVYGPDGSVRVGP